MPIYEYQCTACGHELEILQKISENPLKDCPNCSKAELQKLISAAGFRLKGSGWYETDFKNKGKKKNLADSKSEKKGSDTKPDNTKSSKNPVSSASTAD